MRHGSLFSGIGGFDLAAEWMGWENVFQVEKDSFCQKVLEKNFPNTARYGDIKEFDGTKYRGAVDVISGGFPCQPFSVAGKRKGPEDERHLWPEMFRIIGEVQPWWIVGENVSGLLNWSGGMVLKQIKTDLESAGYKVLPPCVLPACGVDAPHRRDRLWVIAYSTEFTGGTWWTKSKGQFGETGATDGGNGFTSDTNQLNGNLSGLRASEIPQQQTPGIQHDIIANPNGCGRDFEDVWEQQGANERAKDGETNVWENFPTQPPVCGGNDGLPNRLDRIKSLGNAIVPQVAYEIFKAIENVKNI